MQDCGKLSAGLVSLQYKMNLKLLQSHTNHVRGKLERIRHDTHVCMLVDVSVGSRRMLKRRKKGKNSYVFQFMACARLQIMAKFN